MATNLPREIGATAAQRSGAIGGFYPWGFTAIPPQKTGNFADLSAEAVKDAQALGLKVIPWTVNSPPDMERLIDWGVDGIISDYPDRLRELMRRRGMALPKGLKN